MNWCRRTQKITALLAFVVTVLPSAFAELPALRTPLSNPASLRNKPPAIYATDPDVMERMQTRVAIQMQTIADSDRQVAGILEKLNKRYGNAEKLPDEVVLAIAQLATATERVDKVDTTQKYEFKTKRVTTLLKAVGHQIKQLEKELEEVRNYPIKIDTESGSSTEAYFDKMSEMFSDAALLHVSAAEWINSIIRQRIMDDPVNKMSGIQSLGSLPESLKQFSTHFQAFRCKMVILQNEAIKNNRGKQDFPEKFNPVADAQMQQCSTERKPANHGGY